ncbi:MAG: CoA transferase [Acidobacteria bacterium]|nr:CoA transferase [Acidobacteriota bacterium]MCB9398972.1 CoA transferase [Acidobacteriota bacterium]
MRVIPEPVSGPLTGLKVLDLARLYPGPLATKGLADLGAKVTKLEDPDFPDYIGRYPPFAEDRSVYDVALNHNKTPVQLAFSQAEQQAKFRELIEQSDVLVESFRAGFLGSWGLAPETLLNWNPRLIGVSVTAFGFKSSWADRPAHDLNILALCGALDLNRDAAGQPIIPQNQWVDTAMAQHINTRVLAALYQRVQTGQGCWLDLSMLDAILPYLTLQWAHLPFGQKASSFLSGALPCYNLYPTADGRWMALGALESKFWRAFCNAIQHPEWQDLGLDPGPKGQDLKEKLTKLFRQKTLNQWVALDPNGSFCLSPVLNLYEAMALPPIQERQSLLSIEIDGIKVPSPR